MNRNIIYLLLLFAIIYFSYILRNYYIALEKERNATQKLQELKKEVYHVSNIHEL